MILVLLGKAELITYSAVSSYPIIAASAVLGLSGAYLLVTYHRLGLIAAQGYLLFCLVWSLYEAFFPSFTINPKMVASEFPMLAKHLYLAFCIASAGLYAAFFGYLNHGRFRADYAAISKGVTRFWACVKGKPIAAPEKKPS